MKTLLVFPPASDPAHPPLGITSLAGFLRHENEDVELLDLNLGSYLDLLSPESLARCGEKMCRRLEELESRPGLSPEEAKEYRLLAENHLSASYLEGEIGHAVDDLRDPATYSSRTRYATTSSVVRRAMELVSAAHYPVRWYPRGFSMSLLPTRSADVLSATTDRGQNLFIPFFEKHLAEIAGRRPEVIGISLNYYCQLIPGMTLAAIVKRHLPDTFLVVGGGLLCFFEGKWQALAPFRDLVDAWIPFEGEVPLLDLLRARQRREALSEVPGVLRFDRARAVYRPPGPPPDPADLPPPSFDGLPLADYLAPEPVLPILSSRGCYWTRCAFCSHYHLFRRRFRMKPIAQIRREMDFLARRHRANVFYFTDECIPPKIARRLAAEVKCHGLPYQWFGEFRFERCLDDEMLDDMSAGGCRMLMFGLESGVVRVLDLMAKGITPQRAEAVLKRCAKVGIRSFVMFFVGFPTETRSEAEETLRFVERLRHEITHTAFSNFILEQQSPVYREPRRYGITEVVPYPDEDLKIYSDYRVSEGLSAAEAIAFLEEARERPGIRSLIDLYLISRSHLVFLPPEKSSPRVETTADEIDLSAPENVFPLRAEDLVPRTLAFNLDQIRERLGEAPEGVGRCPTHYVYNAQREKLFDVGEDGLKLLGPCDGRFSLQQILAAVAEPNRGEALAFFTELGRKGLVRWEIRP